MEETWQVHEAKAHLSELLERASARGPQFITKHGAQRAVVLSVDEYRSLTQNRPDFKSHLLGGPKVEKFEIERSTDTGRPVAI
jgi:antitoxin Phd